MMKIFTTHNVFPGHTCMASETLPSQSSLFLFPRDDGLTEKLNWMGEDYPAALAAMLAKGFQRQQPGTRLVSLKCLKRPEEVISLFTGTLNKRIRAIFVVDTLLVDPQGSFWQLEVRATCTGRLLSRPEDGILASDVDVVNVNRLYPTGQELLEQLAGGVPFERRGLRVMWDEPLENVLARTGPQVENESGTHYLSWQQETLLGGLEGMVFTSFAPGQAGLRYVSICPENAQFTGPADDGLRPEWEHLTRLFGPPDEKRIHNGYRWTRGLLEFLLLYQEINAPESGKEFQKWVTIRRGGTQPG
jgi:hypothetical protein